MLDLFFLTGEKAIHAIIIKMLQITEERILKIKDMEGLHKFLKGDIQDEFYKVFIKERETAKSLSDFGLCFFENIQRVQL